MPSALDWKVRSASIWPPGYRAQYRGMGKSSVSVRIFRAVEPYSENLTVAKASLVGASLESAAIKVVRALLRKIGLMGRMWMAGDSPYLWVNGEKIEFVIDVGVQLSSSSEADVFIEALKKEGADFF